MGVLFLATVVCGVCFDMGALVGYCHGLRHARRESQLGFPVMPARENPRDLPDQSRAAPH
jgi:hypothetical protein